MSGIIGIINYEEDITDNYSVISNMAQELKKQNYNKEDYFFSKHVNFAFIDFDSNEHLMSLTYNEITYTIIFNGNIYNVSDLKDELYQHGFTFKTHSDMEVLLKSYLLHGNQVCNYLNGVFSFAIFNSKTDEIFISRDQFGIKPLYYAKLNNSFIFASEIKAILKFTAIPVKINKTGICELFGIGPNHSPGYTPFKDIYELEPAHYFTLSKTETKKAEYWKLKTAPHTDSLNETCDKIRFLIEDSVKKQLVSDKQVCTLLSGGLDSINITAIASKYTNNLNTFSVDYKDQEKYFIKNDFQPNTDNYYIELMTKKYNTNHHKIILDSPELFGALEEAMISRDFPGMADVDSSYLLFFKNVKNEASIGLSGECSDEIFGGYPWYFREDAFESNTFPWSLAISERQNLLAPEISSKINLKEYIDAKYNESLKNVEFLPDDSEETKRARKLIYLTSNWFMQTLLDRTDRMCTPSGFDARVPFCDIRIVEYLWNIPWEMKAYKGREKGLLRYAMEGMLPDEIIYRKKSPYPKTHNPSYLKLVKEKLSQIMSNTQSPIHLLLNTNYINNIIETDGKTFARPWFGQLMTGPQLMAYLIQVNMWLEKYKPEIEI